MMSKTSASIVQNTAIAEFMEEFQMKYNKPFDFSKREDQANFCEAMNELGRFLPNAAKTANLSLSVNPNGITGVEVVLGV